MGLIMDRHVGRHLGHTIEIVEDGVTKRVTLYLDGRETASESCILPQQIELKGTLEGKGVKATVVARLLRSSIVSVEVDGAPITLEKNPAT